MCFLLYPFVLGGDTMSKPVNMTLSVPERLHKKTEGRTNFEMGGV
jgi:hypothetical protein